MLLLSCGIEAEETSGLPGWALLLSLRGVASSTREFAAGE